MHFVFVNLYHFSNWGNIFFLFPSREYPVLDCKQKRRRGIKHFDVHLWRIRTVHFLSKDGKGASCESRWTEMLFISRQSRHFSLWYYNSWSTFPYLYLDLACKQICFPPGKGINRRNESTNLEPLRIFSESYTLNLCSVILTILTSFDTLFYLPLLKTVKTLTWLSLQKR